jgi:hypothetical protein
MSEIVATCPAVRKRSFAAPRESHGSGDPCGLAAWVPRAQAWVGKFPPAGNPHPRVRVGGLAWVFFFSVTESRSTPPLTPMPPSSFLQLPLTPSKPEVTQVPVLRSLSLKSQVAASPIIQAMQP